MIESQRVFVIADLSGYTSYLVGGESEAAPLIAGDLVETIVTQLAGDYELAGLEGDAVFVHAPIDSIDGASVLAGVARCYAAFRRRIESVRQATTCTCKACQSAPDLDLKFFVHVGTASLLSIAGRTEVAGSDVILIHRLLKDSAPASQGRRSYVLLTDAAVRALDIDPVASRLEPVRQSYEHFGEVTGYVGEATDAWLDAGDPLVGVHGPALVELERSYPVAMSTLWELLTVPQHRERWEGIEQVQELASSGERGVGTMSRCVARRLATMEEIIDWRPPMGFSRRIRVPDGGDLVAAYDLNEADTATRLRVRLYSPSGAGTIPQAFVAPLDDALARLGDLAGMTPG